MEHANDDEDSEKSSAKREVRIKTVGESVVPARETASKAPGDKQIHPRRPLPPVRDRKTSEERSDEDGDSSEKGDASRE